MCLSDVQVISVVCCTDVQANEKLIEQLRKALEEQEQVMEMQDQHTKKKEEEYQQLLKGRATRNENKSKVEASGVT